MFKKQLVTPLLAVVAVLLLAACSPAGVTMQPRLSQAQDSLISRLKGARAELVVDEKAAQEMPINISKKFPAEAQPLTEAELIRLYDRANPAVVNIRVIDLPDETNLPGQAPGVYSEIPGLDWPGLFRSPVMPGPRRGMGSGFVYDDQGHIVTNYHVVAGADRIVVRFADEREVDAVLVGSDPSSDLAVLQVETAAPTLTHLTLGDSDKLRVGQFVVAIGNPFGLNGSMTTGIVSGLGRMLPSGARTPAGDRFSIPGVVQTDAAINPGNSGGPLLNLNGQVVGVNTAIASTAGGFMGIGYAIPANTVAKIVPQLIETGYVEHPWIGISGQTLTADLAAAMDLTNHEGGGVLVSEVIAGGPAAAAGLRGSATEVIVDGAPIRVGGDIIVAVNDHPVADFDDLLGYLMTATAVGDEITLDIIRAGEARLTVTLELAVRPNE